jgi:type VI secretion system protein ImpL
VLIDPEGRVCDTHEEASSGGKRWRALLEKIDDLRPERPLDKIILVVSARMLLTAGEDALLDLARDALRQVQEVRERFEFALPVYVVVTQCDAVPGFSAFWRAQPEARRDEIFGWSAPPAFASEEPPAWVEAAFASLCDRLRQVMLTVCAEADAASANLSDQEARAASAAEATELDRFFLFPVSFRRLQAPLSRWFAEVFQPSDWDQSFFCRGLYFCGGVAADGVQVDGPRGDVDFLEGLLAERVFAEPHLALPTRKRVWSRNRLIRRAQIAALAALLGLFTLLGLAGFKLAQQMHTLDGAMRTLLSTRAISDPGTCMEVGRFHDLLRQVARIDANSTYAAIPLSWVDDRAISHGADEISNASLQKLVMPAVACRLAKKAKQLIEGGAAVAKRVAESPPAPTDPLADPRRAFLDYVAAVRALEDNLARFRVAARFSSADQNEASLRLFSDLAAYAYDQPLPKDVMAERGALSASLARITFNPNVPLPEGARERYAQRIEHLAADLHSTLNHELAVGPELLAALEQPAPPPRASDERNHLVTWLEWMRQSWLGSTKLSNPCETIRGATAPALADLVHRHGYPERLGTLADTFDVNLCYQPAMNTLASLRFAPYGVMFSVQNGVLELNPLLVAEFDGLGALLKLDYMRLSPQRSFQCLADSAGWNPAALSEAAGYARKYMEFAKARGLPPLGAKPESRPLYDRLAREQLEAVLDDTLSAAQLPETPTPASGGVSRLSDAERLLSRESADFAGAAPPLLEALNLYRQLGYTAAADLVSGCARGQAASQLRRIQTLADQSRLYDLSLDGGGQVLADLAQTRDWLARQVARAQVLAGYASQYLAFLKNSADAGETPAADARGTQFWSNSIDELERYLQFKEPNGQVAYLHSLFIKTLSGEVGKNEVDSCRKRLSDYDPPEFADDLFSQLRRQRLAQAKDECSGSPNASAFAAWRQLADRFNRELAGRYPFGPLSGPDAAPGVVQAFLVDYTAQRGALNAAFAGMTQPQWAPAQRFLGQMDAVAAFFANNLGATPVAPLNLAVEFNSYPRVSPGANQIVAWSLSNGATAAALPNGQFSLDWSWGQPLQLDLTWASGSRLRPQPDATQSDLAVTGVDAVFSEAGPWALLRMIQRHRAATAFDPLAPGRVTLAFDLPTSPALPAAGQVARINARPHLTLSLSGKDAKGAGVALRLPLIPGMAPVVDNAKE